MPLSRFERAKEVDLTTRILAMFLDHGDHGGIASGRQARLHEGLSNAYFTSPAADSLRRLRRNVTRLRLAP